MSEMTPRQRVLTALKRQEPDRVPFLEPVIEEPIVLALMGLPACEVSVVGQLGEPGAKVLIGKLYESELYDPLDVARLLHLDGFGMYLFLRHEGIQREISGRSMVAGATIRSRADLSRIELPDPDDPAIYEPFRRFAEEYRASGYALYAFLNIGSDPVILGMGLENFSIALYEHRGLVVELFEMYTDWYARAAKHLGETGLDFLWFGDNIAFKSAPFVSPSTFRELFLPHYAKVIDHVTLPWIFHSDGNLRPIMEDLLSLGMAGLHPIEPGAMDLADLKRDYGRRVCLVGHISVDALSRGTPQEVDQLVAEAIRVAAPGGGYIVGSSNSVASYCRPENVRAMADAVLRYGAYPIQA